MSNPIRIVIADDHPIVRTGLRRVIEGEPDFEVVAEAGDGETGLELIRKLQPHVAIGLRCLGVLEDIIHALLHDAVEVDLSLFGKHTVDIIDLGEEGNR